MTSSWQRPVVVIVIGFFSPILEANLRPVSLRNRPRRHPGGWSTNRLTNRSAIQPELLYSPPNDGASLAGPMRGGGKMWGTTLAF